MLMWLGRNLISDSGIQHTEVHPFGLSILLICDLFMQIIESPIPFPEDMDTDIH